MDTILAAEINSFGPMPEADAPPYGEDIFVLSGRELQEIISRAIQPLQDEIESLRSQISSVDQQREKEFSLLNEHLVKTVIRVGVLEREVKTKKAAPTEKTSPHLDKLETHLREQKRLNRPAAITYTAAAKILSLSRRRVSQLRPTIEQDPRFFIHVSGKKTFICLR